MEKLKTWKSVCAFIVVLILAVSGTGGAAAADIDYSSWDTKPTYPPDVQNTKYLSAVKALMDAKAITGDTDGLFHPDKDITRAEFASIVVKASHQQNLSDKESHFTDMDGYGWAKPYINRAYENSWIRGVGSGKFAPGKSVTYAEVMTVLVRIRRGQEDELEGKWPGNYIQYADMYNLVGNVNIHNWTAPAPKGDVAILTNRILSPIPMISHNRGAYFSGVGVGGITGSAIAAGSVSITLHNDTFKEILGGTDVSGWFPGLSSNGMKATVPQYSPADVSVITIVITGTPLNPTNAPLSATIPGNALHSGGALAVSPNANAFFNITEQ
ncbi:MAG: S-layer homology domain-containing protein [Clostridiales Family XIII bacterium]|nr:S-layer homology domain-containing protein [Clostridiales Family XIII bacterium]